jgi:hypothetical protein
MYQDHLQNNLHELIYYVARFLILVGSRVEDAPAQLDGLANVLHAKLAAIVRAVARRESTRGLIQTHSSYA